MALVVSLALAWFWPGPSHAQIARLFAVDRLQAHQIAVLSWADEKALGDSIDTYLKQEEGLLLYRPTPALGQFLERVSQAVVAASRYPTRQYTVQIIDDGDINAFATVGGYLYLHRGLLGVIQNEAELAGVLAHEIGHLEQRDGLNQLWHQLTMQDLVFRADRQQQRLVALSGDLRSLSSSHLGEYTADAIAFHILGRAGYGQSALVTLLQRLAETSHQTPPGLLSSHPHPRQRIAQLSQLLANETAPGATAGLDAALYQQIMANLEV